MRSHAHRTAFLFVSLTAFLFELQSGHHTARRGTDVGLPPFTDESACPEHKVVLWVRRANPCAAGIEHSAAPHRAQSTASYPESTRSQPGSTCTVPVTGSCTDCDVVRASHSESRSECDRRGPSESLRVTVRVRVTPSHGPSLLPPARKTQGCPTVSLRLRRAARAGPAARRRRRVRGIVEAVA